MSHFLRKEELLGTQGRDQHQDDYFTPGGTEAPTGRILWPSEFQELFTGIILEVGMRAVNVVLQQ